MVLTIVVSDAKLKPIIQLNEPAKEEQKHSILPAVIQSTKNALISVGH